MNRERIISKTVLFILMFLALATILPALSLAQESREPLTKTEVVRLLENGVTPDRVGALARKYGIAFKMTDEIQQPLRDAGATDELIGMLKALAPSETVSAPVRAAPPAQEPQATPVEPPKPRELILRDGTEVKLRFAEDLNSKTAREGDRVSFVLDGDLRIGDALLLKSGASAVGEVSHVEKAGLLGKPAELSVRIRYLKTDRARIPLRGTKVRETEGKTGTIGILLAPLGLLMPGKQIEVKEGTRLTAYVDEDVSLPAVQ